MLFPKINSLKSVVSLYRRHCCSIRLFVYIVAYVNEYQVEYQDLNYMTRYLNQVHYITKFKKFQLNADK